MSGSSIGAGTAELASLKDEIESLRVRVAELERERDEYAQQNAELFVLQQVFSTMNSTLEIDDILATVLRGVAEALGFGRVVLFDVRESGTAARRLEIEREGLGAVAAATDPEDFVATNALVSMCNGLSDFALGQAGDDDAPLTDAEGTYCMIPLISRNTVRGILYVDRPPSPEVTENQLRVLLDFAAQAAIAIENARLYNETRRLLEETQRLASTDPLTGLANRRALTELLDRELHNAERYESPLTFMVLDLDDLKKINDREGHAAGDDALRRFADVLRRTARRGDIVARFGGDEFVLVMAQTDRFAAEIAIRRIFATLAVEGLRSSVGIAVFPYDGTDATTLFEAADRAVYAAKTGGKNRFTFSSAG